MDVAIGRNEEQALLTFEGILQRALLAVALTEGQALRVSVGNNMLSLSKGLQH